MAVKKFTLGSHPLGSRRGRLVASLALYGGALGAAALLVNYLTVTDYPQIPEHMSPNATATLSGGAAIVCAVLAGLMALWITSGQERPGARNLLVWLAAGFGFGVLSPALTGASLPVSIMLLEFQRGVIDVGELPVEFASALMLAPVSVFKQGVFGLFTGMLAGALFGAGAWPVDVAANTSNRLAATYGPYAIAATLGAVFYGIAAFGPPETLARLG